MAHYYTDNSDLASDRRSFSYYFDNEKFIFTTDNGVFCKDNVDYGSYLLIKNTYRKKLGSKILDLGCGWGVVGIIIKRFNEDIDVTSVDVNPRAIDLTKVNASNNKTLIEASLCLDISALNLLFDSVILNPPIRAGKVVIYGLYEKAYDVLNKNGSLYIVIQKKQGAQSSIKKLNELFTQVTILDKSGGYWVIQAIK